MWQVLKAFRFPVPFCNYLTGPVIAMRTRLAVRDCTLSPPACFTPLPSDLRHAGSCSLRRLLTLSHFAPLCPTLSHSLDDRPTYLWNTPSLLAALALWCGRVISHHPSSTHVHLSPARGRESGGVLPACALHLVCCGLLTFLLGCAGYHGLRFSTGLFWGICFHG
jgi:hypothetical protein